MHFLNERHAHENVARFVRAVRGTTVGSDSVPRAYRAAIGSVRPIPPPSDLITVTFEDGPWGKYLVENKIFEDIFVGIGPSSDSERTAWADLVAESVDYVCDLDGGLGRIVRLLVSDVVVLNSERTGGGSASQIPGLVCISPGGKWSMIDYAESTVHEATHLNLFVADMVHGLYVLPTSELGADKYRVLSAVKVGERRPLDKAFHSAVVAVPLMYMQYLRGETALVDQFQGSLLECSEGLVEKLDLFTPYGKLLVDQLHRFATDTDFERVRESISSTEFASV